jgi:hypothetical protein
MSSVDELISVVGDGLGLSESEEGLVRDLYEGKLAKYPGETIRGEVLRRTFMHADLVSGGQPGRFCIEGMTVIGKGKSKKLDLTGLKLDFSLQFRGVELPTLVLEDTRLLALELLGGSAAGLKADRIEIAHDLVTTDNFTCRGGFTLRSASIGGDLNCDGSQFLPNKGTSIMLDGARIGGRLFLGKKGNLRFRASTGVYGRNMRVAGGIICSDGQFDREVNLTRAQVDGDLRFLRADIGSVPATEDGAPDGELLLGSMHIGGDLSLAETNFHGPRVVLSRTRVEGSLRWSLERTAPHSEKLLVDLMQARVDYLHDDCSKWHGATVHLDGFSFDGVAADGDRWLQKRKDWLDSQPPGEWSPYPYGQVRAALLSSGYESAAREIAIERERVRQRKGRLTKAGRMVHCLYGKLFGYGYKPLPFFLVAVVAVFGFGLLFSTIPKCPAGAAAGSCDGFAFPAAHSPTFDWFLFSLDAFTPIDLGQTGAWNSNGSWYPYAVALETSLGWLFAGLLLGAVTGILRRD